MYIQWNRGIQSHWSVGRQEAYHNTTGQPHRFHGTLFPVLVRRAHGRRYHGVRSVPITTLGQTADPDKGPLPKPLNNNHSGQNLLSTLDADIHNADEQGVLNKSLGRKKGVLTGSQNSSDSSHCAYRGLVYQARCTHTAHIQTKGRVPRASLPCGGRQPELPGLLAGCPQ